VDPRNLVLDGSLDPLQEWELLRGTCAPIIVVYGFIICNLHVVDLRQ